MIQTFKTHLTGKKQLTSDVYLFQFQLNDPTELNFQPGQYLILFCPANGGMIPRRLYSIASPTSQKNSFELLIKIIPNGVASQYLMKATNDEVITFQGPAGVFIPKNDTKTAVFLVTGTGVAPVCCMLESLLPPGREVKLFFGLAKYQDVYFLDKFKELTKQYPHFQFSICLSREENLDMVPAENKPYFSLGRVTKVFDDMVTKTQFALLDANYYLCGDRLVVESLRQFLEQKNIPKSQIVFEKF